MRTKPTMRKRLLRRALVAAFSAVAAVGVLGGLSSEKSEVRADTAWPAVAVSGPTASGDILPAAGTGTERS